MICPKCGAEPKEFWYDGSCIEHGRPEPVEGRWYYVKLALEPEVWSAIPSMYRKGTAGRGPRWQFYDAQLMPPQVSDWLPIPTVEELLLTTRGKV